MIYSYNRVSSKDQILDRQCNAFNNWAFNNNVEEYQIFSDKQSGKDFERKEYQEMLKVLKKGDLVVIKSIDRLGRNYDLIIQEWTRITKTIGADILVLDMPLLDTRSKKDNLTGKFISDIVLQILSYVAETERANIKQRQAEGIKIAKEKGVKFGVPAKMNEKALEDFKIMYDKGYTFKDLATYFNMSVRHLQLLAHNLKFKPRLKGKSYRYIPRLDENERYIFNNNSSNSSNNSNNI